MSQRIYTQMAVRAGEIWRENEQLWDRQLYARTGLLWMVELDDAFMASALPLLNSRPRRIMFGDRPEAVIKVAAGFSPNPIPIFAHVKASATAIRRARGNSVVPSRSFRLQSPQAHTRNG